MADLHDSMTPDDREENALVPPDALRRFVDAHARLMYERERLTPTPCSHVAKHTGMYEPFDTACEKCGSFLTPNVELTGAARPYRAASSD